MAQCRPFSAPLRAVEATSSASMICESLVCHRSLLERSSAMLARPDPQSPVPTSSAGATARQRMTRPSATLISQIRCLGHGFHLPRAQNGSSCSLKHSWCPLCMDCHRYALFRFPILVADMILQTGRLTGSSLWPVAVLC